ncbi:hypothetical protein [Nocardiopsis metallicus]|uniref:Uncharacterized protein n=1 Tax=Nocardiopsis metallicus TaxID=179819 RepID=A0A840W6J0_9ACTN|nr:hypothetical protein [Nocardiopsis metallicus]MBB5490963.1 hypothetical protein [Nocardiopsis metallicus]
MSNFIAVEFNPWTVPVTKPHRTGEEVWFMDLTVSTEDIDNAYEFFCVEERDLIDVANDRLREERK